MVNRWLNRANARVSLTSAAVLLVSASLFGQLLGFMRTQVVNGNFNTTGHITTDAYFAAFKIPDFFFYTIAAGALGVAFMPFLADKLAQGDRQSVWKITSSLLNFLGVMMFGVGLVLLIFTEPLLRIVVGHNLSPQETHDAVLIMRLVAFNPLLFTISGILTSLQQTFGRFFFYALAPIIYNSCIIASVYVFKNNIGLVGLGIGALVGALLQLLIVALGLVGLRFRYVRGVNFRSPEFRGVLRNLPPRSNDQGLDSINSIVETNRASTLKPGSITVYENAYTLHLAPILLIGTAISTAAFPRLNSRLSQGRPDLFRRDFLMVLRAIIWIVVPVVVIAFFTRGYLARLIFKNPQSGIAEALGYLTGAIFFRTIYSIISRWFYSQKDTRTPLFVSLFAIVLNVYLAFTLVKATQDVTGLAMAQSIVAAAEVIILVAIMLKRDHKLFDGEFWSGVSRILSVTGFTVLLTYIMISLIPFNAGDRGFIKLSAKLLAVMLPPMILHIWLSSLFGLEEVRPVINKLRALVFRPVRIQ
jgi:putative peptidoglycan lipid II flippase